MEARTENQRTLLTQTITGPANGATVYTDAIVALRPNFELSNRRVSIGFNVSAAVNAGTRVNLYGSFTPTGTKILIKANLAGDAAPTVAPKYEAVDLNALPMPYYFVGCVGAADETAKTLSVYICD
jgi:hypothetical protein